MLYYVYVLRSEANGDLYKGFTEDLKRRTEQHNRGETFSTKSGKPWKLVYCEIFTNKQDAIVREKFLKTGWGRNFLKKVLKHTLQIV